MEKIPAKEFIERVKLESSYHKFLKKDLIYQFIDAFKYDYPKMKYSKNIENPLEMALQFYKSYNDKYYNMVINSINEGKIIISNDNDKSFVNTETNQAFIKPLENDSDIFVFVHEFAHFIDRNLDPMIIPDEYYFLCEVYSFYMEKQLEIWLNDKKYDNLIETRKHNRLYSESKMLKTIEYEMFCEETYKKNGKIELDNLNNDIIKFIINYEYDLNDGIVNFLLRYPLANILSDYLVYNQEIKNDADICKICLNTNLYNVLANFETGKKLTR